MTKQISRRLFIKQTGLTVGAVSITGAYAKESFDDSVPQLNDSPKRRLGRTGWSIFPIGFGGGSRYYEWIPKEADAEKILHYAVQLGINYFDTARNYGKNQKSEIRFGKYLTPNYRDDIFLVSKTAARTYDGVMNDIEASLQNLKTDYLDLYHMHAIRDIQDVSELSAAAGGFKAFQKLKDEKVIRNIGFSFHADWNPGIKEAVEQFNPDVIMCALNAFGKGRNSGSGNEENLLPLAKERDIGIVAMKVTGQNALIGKVKGRDLLHYALGIPGVAIANVGIDGFATLESCVDVAKEPPLSVEERTKIKTKLDSDNSKSRMGYLDPGYIDGEQFA